MDWTILGIGPTDDKKAITAAYRSKLRTTNPEDKPEEFKALRAAYEEALHLADRTQDPEVRDESPLGQFLEQVEGLYTNFSRRINPDQWRELLHSDFCTALDTRPQAEDGLLRFLMDHYYLPRSVWQTMDAVFGWQEREQELCESYPWEFIDACVLGGIRLEQSMPYDLFEPGLNGAACDDYRRLYHQYGRAASEQEQAELLEHMEALPESHPYGRALRCHWLMGNDRTEACFDAYRAIIDQHPNHTEMNNDYALLCIRAGKLEEAESALSRILTADPKNVRLLRTKAELLIAKDQPEEAKEVLYDVMHAAMDDPDLMDTLDARLQTVNKSLIPRYAEALEADPGNWDTAIDLAWCYLQSNEAELAMEVARKIDPDRADAYDYHNLMAKLNFFLEHFDQAEEHTAAVIALVRSMEPDGTEDTADRIQRLPEMLQTLGNCMCRQGKTDEAQPFFLEALSLAPDDPGILTTMGRIYYANGRYDVCLELMEHLTKTSPGSWFGHMMQAMALYQLHRDRESFEATDRAIALHGGDLTLYFLKMQLLLRNGLYEDVRGILDFLQQQNAPADICVDFIHAQLLELEQQDPDAALNRYQAIARQFEEGAPMLDPAHLYFRIAYLMGERSGPKDQEARDTLISILDTGLDQDPHNSDCLDYKAWLLSRSGRVEEAIEIYKTQPTPNARRKLADLYFDQLDTFAAEARSIYEELLRQRQTPELCFYAARCCEYLGEEKQAEQYFRLALELDPGDIDAHAGLAYAREAEGRNEEALAHMDKAIASMWENTLFYDWLIEHRIKILRRMGRHADALAAADEAMDRAGYHRFPIQFEILCQFGLWDQAEELLVQWQRETKTDPDLLESIGRLHLLRRRMLKATFAYGKLKHKMTREVELTLRCQLADLEANHKRLLQLIPQLIEVSSDPTNPMLNLALVMFWNGSIADAREAAAKALVVVDAELTKPTGNATLYRTRRSILLAILGQEAEARAELEICRRSPLCRHCPYGRCKDADIYEAYIEEIVGNYKRAMALHLAGQKNWPDELDFISGEIRLKKKKRG